jgi:hypothetical protein
MTRKFQLLLLIPLLSCACSRTQSAPAVPPAVAPKAQAYKSEAHPNVEEGKEEPIKAATPEDPGPIATVVSPLAVWQREAERRARNPQMSEELVEVSTPLPADHVALDPTPPANNFLHKRLVLRNYSEFTFVVPPNQASPRLHGFFRSWADGGSMKDAVNIDLLLLNDREFEDFHKGRAGKSTYAVEATHNQAVDYAIASTTKESRFYHLVFVVPDGPRSTMIDADFTLSFE